MNRKFVFLPALALLLALALPSASAVPVTFAGGNGSPLTMTLALPVTYTITADFVGDLRFVFEDTGELFGGPPPDPPPGTTSNISYTINGGAPRPIDAILSSFSGGDISPTDTVIFEGLAFDVAVSIGDFVVLSTGTLTTGVNIPQAPPGGTDFSTFIAAFNSGGGGPPFGISEPGTVSSVPDSLSTLWLGLPIAVMLAFAQLRRFAARFQSA